MSGFEIKKIVREFVSLEPAKNGLTYGQALDEALAKGVRDGCEVQSIELLLTEEDWTELRQVYDAGSISTDSYEARYEAKAKAARAK